MNLAAYHRSLGHLNAVLPFWKSIRARVSLWWSSFVIMLVCGFVLFATGYRHGLPYLDLGDEVTMWTMGRAYMDPSWQMYQPEYPPGFLIVSSTIQRLQIALGNPYYDPAGTIEKLRLLSVIGTTVSLGLVMLLAYRLAGPMAGLSAGLVCISLPLVNSRAKFATVDPWLSMWFMVSIVAGIEGWYRKSARLLSVSLLFAMLAAIFKWQGAAALGMPILGCLTFWNVKRSRTVILAAIFCLISAMLGYWAIAIHHALEGSVYLPGTKTSIPTVGVVVQNVMYQLTAIGPGLIFGVLPLIALVLAAAMPAARRLYSRMGLWSLPLVIIAFDIILSFNGAPVFERHYIAIMALLCSLAGCGLALLVNLFGQVATRYRKPWLRWSLCGVTAVIVAVPMLGTLNEIRLSDLEMSRPDRRAYFAEWARTTAIDGPMAITNPSVAAAVQSLYGYRGRPIETPYNEGTSIFPRDEDITQQLIDAKRIRYIVTGPDFQIQHVTSPLTRLITYGPDDSLRGEEWAAFYVGPLPALLPLEQRVTFGSQVTLRGYSLSKQSACPGDPLDLQLLWGATKRPTGYYSLYVHLYNEKTGELPTPIAGQLVSDARPTVTWTTPDELLIGPHYSWSLPTDLQPGTYELWLGVFDPVGGTRLTLPDGTDHHILTAITVTGCAAKPG